MIIKTSTLKVEVNSIEDVLNNTLRTPVSDNLAKQFGFNKKDCSIWNGNLFVNNHNNTIFVFDFFTKERQFYDFNVA